MSFLSYTTSIMLIALFTIALVSFAVNYAADNKTSVSIADDPDFESMNNKMVDEVNNFYISTNQSVDAFSKSTISSQTEASEGGTQFKVTPSNSLSIAKNSISIGFKKIFGSDSGFGIFFTALISLLGLIAAALAYKAWVGRDPGN